MDPSLPKRGWGDLHSKQTEKTRPGFPVISPHQLGTPRVSQSCQFGNRKRYFLQTLPSLPRGYRRWKNLRGQFAEPTTEKFHGKGIEKRTNGKTDDPIRHEREERHRHDALGIESHSERNPSCRALHPKKTNETGLNPVLRKLGHFLLIT